MLQKDRGKVDVEYVLQYGHCKKQETRNKKQETRNKKKEKRKKATQWVAFCNINLNGCRTRRFVSHRYLGTTQRAQEDGCTYLLEHFRCIPDKLVHANGSQELL